MGKKKVPASVEPDDTAAPTHDPETGIPYYHAMRLPADIVAAADLRNGMTPAQVDEAVNRVLGGQLPT